MLLGKEYSFKLVSKKHFKKPQKRKSLSASLSIDGVIRKPIQQERLVDVVESVTLIEPQVPVEKEILQEVVEESVVTEPEYVDSRKRSFLKLASMASLGAMAVTMLPKKAEAYVMGATPTSGVVGVKDSSNNRISPATEETLQTLLAGQGVTKLTTSLTNSGDIKVPASGKKIRVYSVRFSLTADMSNVSFRFTSGGTDFEKYMSPKTGGLYGANNHPNYIEGGVDQALYCVISGTGTVQINLDYTEV